METSRQIKNISNSDSNVIRITRNKRYTVKNLENSEQLHRPNSITTTNSGSNDASTVMPTQTTIGSSSKSTQSSQDKVNSCVYKKGLTSPFQLFLFVLLS